MKINYGRSRMVLRQLILNRENVIRAFLYLLWCAMIGSLVLFNFEVMWGTNTQGCSCNELGWQYGMLYNWQAWGRPCIYSGDFYFRTYISYLVIYLLFDCVRRKILACNPSIAWRLAEMSVVFVLYWSHMIYPPENLTMYYTSFLGSLQFLWPFFVLAAGVKFLSQRAVVYTLGSLISMWVILILADIFL